jgi:predicted ATP-dependent serine protease
MSPSVNACEIVIDCKMYRDERGQARLFWVCEKCGLEWRDASGRCPRCEHMRTKVELYSARRVARALHRVYRWTVAVLNGWVLDDTRQQAWEWAVAEARRVLREEAKE